MGDVLAELEDVLRSKPTKDKMTQKEELLLQQCKAAAIADFTVGALASSAVVWIATKSLSHGQRFQTSVGSAIIAGMWRFNSSLNSCVHQILELEGSRIQKELAQIILTKHYNDASRMKLVRKHFFSEEVFSYSNPEKAYNRWRFRNFYNDDFGIQTSEAAQDSSSKEKPDTSRKKQLNTTPSRGEVTGDPLDFFFGEGDGSEEIPHSDNNIVPKRRLRAHKRAHRRHRAHHPDLKTSGMADAD